MPRSARTHLMRLRLRQRLKSPQVQLSHAGSLGEELRFAVVAAIE